ncbi:uncharacterized protein LOC111332633 isoform X1 [Stylophora pistillata]|nr:uncharacterized protein LOC111332633 isoform X1 [Stylophora pistillata]
MENNNSTGSVGEYRTKTQRKRKVEEMSGGDTVPLSEDESSTKQSKLTEALGSQKIHAGTGVMLRESGSRKRKASSEDFSADIVFALDYSSSITDIEELQMEIDFVQHLSKSLDVDSGDSSAAVVLYEETAQTVIPFDLDGRGAFSDKLKELRTGELRPKPSEKRGKTDLALTEAAEKLNAVKKRSRNQHQLVILFTAGGQLANKDQEEDKDLLTSAYEQLSSQDIRVIVVPIGLETDFKELGLIVKRPQYLFPLSSFDELNQEKAEAIALFIKQTVDIDVYAKRVCLTFTGKEELETKPTLWEKINLCSDVMEGAWYKLYDQRNKRKTPDKVKKLIRESIDNFHRTLVSDSKVSISLAVFGPLGAGKSFFLNSLLNWKLGKYSFRNGPLPSARGGSQTPIPIYVKYGKQIQVLVRKEEKEDVWVQPEELDISTLARVNETLKTKFEDGEGLRDASCVELRGPFPIFDYLKKRKMTTTGHLELDIDVEFVDVPGYGDEIGNEKIDVELSKADVVLFFDSGKSGRPVSAEDIAQVFRRRDEFDFPKRPKIVHLVNDREEYTTDSYDLDKIREQKREQLERAWSSFHSSSVDDKDVPSCYRDVRARLPQLNGEDLLIKLSEESDVVLFHPNYDSWLNSLKHVIDDHIHRVKMKQIVHPFLLDVHWTAKRLKERIGKSLNAEKKKHLTRKVGVKEGQVNFELMCNSSEMSNLVDSFLGKPNLNFNDASLSLINTFLKSHETVQFLSKSIKLSLEMLYPRLIEAFSNVNWSTAGDIPGDLIDLVEILCKGRVEQYCANTAPAYIMTVLEAEKIRKLPKKSFERWSSGSLTERKGLCRTFLGHVMENTGHLLEKDSRDKKFKKSHFHLIEQLKKDVKDLFAVRCLEDDENRPELLRLLYTRLKAVIKFCTDSIRDFNPHPSLDVEAHPSISLRENMICTRDEKPVQSKYTEIIKEISDLLIKQSPKGADPIRRLETKLKLAKDALALGKRQSKEQMYHWAKVLLNVLSDPNHFDVQLKETLLLPSDDPDPELKNHLKLARKRLFAYQKSLVTCKIVSGQNIPDNEMHVRKNSQEKFCLEVLISSKLEGNLNVLHEEFKDPMQEIAPIFIPTIRPGPLRDIRGNFFLEEDPWSNDYLEYVEDEGNSEEEKVMTEESKSSTLNIFLVVEEKHLRIIQSTITSLRVPKGRNIIYVVLPQQGRGIGVTRAIIKSLAEALHFHLYWTVDDDIQFMYEFDEKGRKWVKCSIARGLLFGQRVFQTCQKKAVKALSKGERYKLFMETTKDWPDFASDAKMKASFLFLNDEDFSQLQRNPSLLHSPFVNILEYCGGDSAKEEEMKTREEEFVRECKKHLFEDSINHIAGVSLAHVSTKKYDYMSKHPTADYMVSEQRYQVVLHNSDALKEKNYVTDEIIFHPDEYQIKNIDRRNTPYWGVRGADKSFSRALTVGGTIGYQVIRVVHNHKKLVNVFDRVGPSYESSQSAYGSEDEEGMV